MPSRTRSQEIFLDSIPKTCIVNFFSVSPPDPCLNDVNVFIAIRKGVRSCTQHPISNFVSLSHLSPSFHSFSYALSLVLVLQNVSGALSQPQWKAAMEEEMRAFAKTHT